MKVLMLSNVASMIKQFNMDNIRILQDLGAEVEVACNFETGNPMTREAVEQFKSHLESMQIVFHQIGFSRSSIRLDMHAKSYKEVRSLLEREGYDFVHCHGPISSAILRVAAKKVKTPVLYTAHGFQFVHGGPILDWLLFYPIEKWLSKATTILITINKHDYDLAMNHFHAKKCVYVPGVGIHTAQLRRNEQQRENKRKELHLGNNDVMLFSVGELSHRKNHSVIVKALMGVDRTVPLKYIVAGQGALHDKLVNLILKNNLQNVVSLIGYRNDIPGLLSAADIFVFPSHREGLAIAGLEAMASGLPVVGANARGVSDYIVEGENGFVCNAKSPKDFKAAIEKLISDKELREEQGRNSVRMVQKFDKSIINKDMESIYSEMLSISGKQAPKS